MWQTVRLCGLVGVFGLLAPAARADSVTWTIKPAEPALGPGTIICSGTVSFTTGYTPTIGVFAIPKNGGVVYPGVVAMTVKGTQAKFDATIMNGANKLPNDTYSVWVSVKLTAGMTFTFICSSVETAGVANGAGNHDPKATVTFTPFNNLAGNVSGQGTYAITGQGWKDDQGPHALPTPRAERRGRNRKGGGGHQREFHGECHRPGGRLQRDRALFGPERGREGQATRRDAVQSRDGEVSHTRPPRERSEGAGPFQERKGVR